MPIYKSAKAKKHFSLTERVSDIVSMALIYNKYLTHREIQEDYEIKSEAAYRTIALIKKIEYLSVEKDKKNNCRYIIKLSNKLSKSQKANILRNIVKENSNDQYRF